MRGPSMKNLMIAISIFSLFSNLSLAQDYPQTEIPNGVSPDVVPVYQMPTGVTAKPTDTVQDAARKSSANNGSGKMMGGIAMGVTGTGVALNCFGPPYANCGWWVAGLAASTYVTMSMGTAKEQSQKTLDAVTVGDGSGAGRDVIPSYTDTPQFQQAQDLLNKVGKLGYKVDLKTGNVKAPNGKTYNANLLGNSGAMQAAGMSSSEIGAANAFGKNLKAAIDKQLKAAGADAGGDMFGDAGGGGGSATKGAEGGALPDGYLAGIPGKDSQGDRGPAQVAGLQKNLDGTPIGISQDNLFSMIGKRYQWCSNKGCFLPTVKP
jgi:hypothetical protein